MTKGAVFDMDDHRGNVRRRVVRAVVSLALLAATCLLARPYLVRHRNPEATRRMFAAIREFDAQGIVDAVKQGADPDAENDYEDMYIQPHKNGAGDWWNRLVGQKWARTGRPTALMTATYVAAYVQDDRPIRAMVKAGANLQLKDRDGKIARDYGVIWGSGPGTTIYKLLTPP